MKMHEELPLDETAFNSFVPPLSCRGLPGSPAAPSHNAGMQPALNATGLTRTIPEAVKREVRQRSRFGCVICRSGFFEYEHITPFVEVAQHDPAHICCLCASCHSRVTRGQLSKETVRAHYAQIQAADAGQVGPPVGHLDFHPDTVSLALGGLFYPPP